MTLTIGSLFSGIGGLDLGLERGLSSAGVHAETIWQVEQNEYASRVLARHWPNAKRYTDVRTVTAQTVDPVDILCGGFPCQDISVAGKGAGLAGEKSGLFFEMARIVGEIRPRIVCFENVSAITSRGLDTVLGTMAALGYDARWGGLRASEMGAPHRRERWFCVAWLADSEDSRQRRDARELEAQSRAGEKYAGIARGAGDALGRRRDLADSDGERRVEQQSPPELDHQGQRSRSGQEGRCEGLPESLMGRGSDGIPTRLDTHRWPAPPGPQHPWEPPRTRARQPHDRERLKALGNSVVPMCGAVIGRWIADNLLTTHQP